MKAARCPVLNSDEERRRYNELIQKVGGDKEAAYRMYYRYSHLTDPIGEALKKFDLRVFSIQEKERILNSISGKIIKVEGYDPETNEPVHYYKDANGKEILSVSRALDNREETKYRGGATSEGTAYSDKGTIIHKLFEYIINFDGDKTSAQNIAKFAKDNNLSQSFVDQVQNTITYLKTKGKVLAELKLGDLDVGIAGTGDIIVLGNDGKIYLYDIKTAHLTKAGADKGVTKIWNPVEHFGGYKAIRYPSQLEFYSRMIERALGQPVSEAFIIPIEIKYKNNNPSEGFEEVKMIKEFDHIRKYGTSDTASDIVSDFFGDNQVVSELPKLISVDDSDEFIERHITGRISGKVTDLEKRAEEELAKATTNRKGGKSYFNPIQKKYVSLRSNNVEEQKRQIVDEYLSKINRGRANVDESIKNYLITGEDAYLSSTDVSSDVRKLLDLYKGRRNIKVNKLSSIEGFEKKQGWILIEDGDVEKAGGTYDLIYLGNDNLDETLNIGRKMKKGDTLFGKYHTKKEANYILESELKNTVRDAKKLEAGLIALKIKESQPNASFRRVLVGSTLAKNAAVESADLHRIIPTIQKFGKIHANLLPTNMQALFAKKELFDPQQYRQNSIEAYKAFINMYQNVRSIRFIKDEEHFKSFTGDKDALEEFAYKAIRTARQLEEAGLTSDPVVAEEARLLRNIYYDFNKIGQEIFPIGWKNGKFSMPQYMPVAVIQDIVKKMNIGLLRMKGQFWETYKKPAEAHFNKLFSKWYQPGRVRDALLNDTDRYYEPLFQKATRSVIVGKNPDGSDNIKQQEINTFKLKRKGSPEYEALSQDQKDFIDYYNSQVKKAMDILNIKWEEGNVPLVPASFKNNLFKASKMSGAAGTVSQYQQAFRQSMEEFEHSFSDTIDKDSKFTLGKANIFTRQANTETSDPREAMIGISDDAVNLEENLTWDTNLEVVLDTLMLTAYRQDEMERMNDIVLAAKSHFEWQRSNLFEERLDANIKWTESYYIANIKNRDIDAGTWYNKAARTANKVASYNMIAFSPAIAVGNVVAQQIAAMSNAVSNSLGDNAKWGIGDWTKALGTILNPVNNKKVNLLLEQYQLYDMDMSSFMNGLHRYGNKSIFGMKWAYGMLRAGDWLSRSQMLIAQMHKDGVWDAYSVVDGKLVYDESKDPRDPLLKETIKANMKKDNSDLVVDGKMTRAYDYNITTSIKAQIDAVLGGYDRETRAMYNFSAWGKLFGLFKTYMPSRIDRLTSVPFQSSMIGKYELQSYPNGNKEYLWKGDQIEGLWHSMNMGILYMNRANNGAELTEVQRANIKRVVGDFLMIALLLGIGGAGELGDDEDKYTAESFSKFYNLSALYGASRDLISVYNVFQYGQFLSTPIALEHMATLLKRIYNLSMNANDPDTNVLVDGLKFHVAYRDYMDIVNFLEEE